MPDLCVVIQPEKGTDVSRMTPADPAPTHARPALSPLAGRHAIILAIAGLLSYPAQAEPASPAPGVASRYTTIVAEAAERFAISPAWIRAVIDVESHGDPRAVSPKGAIGLMQIMPKTYGALRLRYALGADPYDPHDNIMAGAAYLREMFDRFGAPGFLAAYNAGPERYRDYLRAGHPLPLETDAYVVQLTLRLPDMRSDGRSADMMSDTEWQTATLFAAHQQRGATDTAAIFVAPSASRSSDSRAASGEPLHPPRGTLFISLSSKKTEP